MQEIAKNIIKHHACEPESEPWVGDGNTLHSENYLKDKIVLWNDDKITEVNIIYLNFVFNNPILLPQW